MNFSIKIILIAFCLAQPVYAQTPGTLKNQIETEKSNRSKADKDIARLQKDLTRQARAVQRAEHDLHAIEDDIRDLEQQKRDYDARLQDGRIALSAMISAALRMGRVPDMAIVLTPDMPEQAAQSAMVLKRLSARIDAEKKKIATELVALKSVEEALHQAEDKAIAKQKSVAETNKQIEQLLSERRKQRKQSDQAIKEKEIALIRASRKAKSLGELIRKADKVIPSRTADYAKFKPKTNTKTNDAFTSFRAMPPLQGRMIKAFHSTDSMGGLHKGVTLAGRDNALIVSPAMGTVKFTGAFKHYGNIVIIEHGHNFHSLIAGFEKIDTVVGQTVKSGEPLGRLKRSGTTNAGSLYFELRQNGDPVNPSPYIRSVG